MLIATTPFIAGWRVTETKGQVFGLVVRSRGLGGNIMASLEAHISAPVPRPTVVAPGFPKKVEEVLLQALEKDPNLIQVLDAWRAASFPLGNHAWSHMNLNSNTVEDWEADVHPDMEAAALAEQALQATAPAWQRY